MLIRKQKQNNDDIKIMKPLSELNLLDRFLFDEVMEDTQTAKDVLEIIMGREVSLLDKNEIEKEFRKSPQLRSIRIDVFSMDEERNVYDTEMQQKNTVSLPKRSRYYQSYIDVSLLEPGKADFNELNDVYVIIIAPFDLWGFGRYRYTFRYQCQEEPTLRLEDGSTRIFLNTKGRNKEGVSDELIEFLRFVENSSSSADISEKSERLRRIHNRVCEVKENEKVGVKYMQRWEELVYAKKEGREEGREEGRRLSILECLEEFGEIPKELQDEINTQTDIEVLRKWLKLAARAESLEEFVGKYRE